MKKCMICKTDEPKPDSLFFCESCCNKIISENLDKLLEKISIEQMDEIIGWIKNFNYQEYCNQNNINPFVNSASVGEIYKNAFPQKYQKLISMFELADIHFNMDSYEKMLKNRKVEDKPLS